MSKRLLSLEVRLLRRDLVHWVGKRKVSERKLRFMFSLLEVKPKEFRMSKT